MKNRIINVKDVAVTISTRHEQDYISLTDMVKHLDGGSALIEQWLKNKDTVLFLGVRGQLNNPSFNSLEFEGIKNEAGRNSFFLSAKKWVDATDAVGLHAKAGRYGAPSHTKTSRSNLAHGSARNSSVSRAKNPALLPWSGTFSAPCQGQLQNNTQTVTNG